MVRNVVAFDDSLLSFMSRTFDPDGIKCWEYLHSIDNNKTRMAMYQM
jgi:hypothetical protein